MKDYHDLNLKCDVLLLTDVFEKLRNNGLKNYGLRPSHYLSAPALSWDAMLSLSLFQMQTCIYSLKKVWEAEFPTLLRDTVKPKISI